MLATQHPGPTDLALCALASLSCVGAAASDWFRWLAGRLYAIEALLLAQPLLAGPTGASYPYASVSQRAGDNAPTAIKRWSFRFLVVCFSPDDAKHFAMPYVPEWTSAVDSLASEKRVGAAMSQHVYVPLAACACAVDGPDAAVYRVGGPLGVCCDAVLQASEPPHANFAVGEAQAIP